MMQFKSLLQAIMLAVLVVSFQVAPAKANLSVTYQDDGSSNPFQTALCSIVACDSSGDITAFDYINDLVYDLSNIDLTIGRGNNRKRKLRGRAGPDAADE